MSDINKADYFQINSRFCNHELIYYKTFLRPTPITGTLTKDGREREALKRIRGSVSKMFEFLLGMSCIGSIPFTDGKEVPDEDTLGDLIGIVKLRVCQETDSMSL